MKKNYLLLLVFILLAGNVISLTAFFLGKERLISALERRALFGSKLSESVTVPFSKIDGNLISDDPLSRYQWGLRMMLDGADYWSIQGTAPRDVVVAVIDKGVHTEHLDLKGRAYVGGGVELY